MEQDGKLPTNETPEVFYTILNQLQKYGWFILLALVTLLYIWNKFVPKLIEWKQDYQDRMEAESREPEVIIRQQEALERSRQRLQEKVNADAERFKEKQLLLEQQKRREKIEDWERHQEGKGYRSKIKKPPEEETDQDIGKPKIKAKPKPSDNYPLMGSCSRPSYRPGRRNVSGGG